MHPVASYPSDLWEKRGSRRPFTSNVDISHRLCWCKRKCRNTTKLTVDPLFDAGECGGIADNDDEMNLNKRRLIFCTFVYSCAAICLVGAGLGTKRWVVASARRTSNTTESVGQVNLGLFHGDKYLNIGYGLRTYSVDGKWSRLTCFRFSTQIRYWGPVRKSHDALIGVDVTR